MARKPRSIPWSLKQAISAMLCAVCGLPYGIKVDHIIPVSKGGTADPHNLQPLCHACNHIKGNRHSNLEIGVIVRDRGIKHFLDAIYLYDTRHFNPYDAPGYFDWYERRPDRVAYANRLQSAFLMLRFGGQSNG